MSKNIFVSPFARVSELQTGAPVEFDGDSEPDPMSDEILFPLLNSTVKSILVKGQPGTGKTTLALELLRIYGKGVYVSTCISREESKGHHPALNSLFDEGHVLEINP